MIMTAGGDEFPFEWKSRELHADTYICPLKFTIELNPDMSDELTYVFTKNGLSAILELLVSKIEDVKGWGAMPVLLNTVSGTIPPLPLHAGLTHASGEAGASEEASSSCIGGKASCTFCSLEIKVEKMRLHVAGHILDKVHQVRTF